MSRAEFSKSTKVRRFLHCGGKCENCRVKLTPATGINYDHVKPCALDGNSDFSNCNCLCTNCHKAKTAADDTPVIARSNRQRATHIGARRKTSRPLAGSRASGIRRRMNGRVERW